METQPISPAKNEKRRLAIVLALSVVMNFLLLMYAFVQKSAAETTTQELIRCGAESREQVHAAERALQDALRSTQLSREAAVKQANNK